VLSVPSVALVIFLRGVNVGGHRTFRPKQLAEQLRHLDAVNIGAAGTFVVRKRISRARARAEFAKRLPFETSIAICDGKEISALIERAPYGPRPAPPGIVRFVSVLCAPVKATPPAPIRLPSTGQWLVRVIAFDRRFVVGEYRRHMQTIRYLGSVDKAVGVPVTTRNWSTINQIHKVLES
jgi:uncharacterized protein (DUF1697 family)